MSVQLHEVRSGAYYDSVILMQLQKEMAALPHVEDAGAVMATGANRELLHSAGFDIAQIEADANDLVLVVRADDKASAENALQQVDELLQRRRSSHVADDYRPRSLKAAAGALPQADWVLVSVPGRYAAEVSHEALDLGKHVFLYSDNVAVEEERNLKEKARERGLLVMGPDCGTAIVGGVGLGFANRVRPGNIGIVAASGTGLQAVSAAIHNGGGGISHAFGTGGRDLDKRIDGATAKQALRFLIDDRQTDVIVLISKPPAAEVAGELLRAALSAQKPVVVSFVGYPPPARNVANVWFAAGLSDAAELALKLRDDGRNQPNVSLEKAGAGKFLRGLFSGGTLAYEATLLLQAFLHPLHSNTPVGVAQPMQDALKSREHTIVDMGDDQFTQGRLHPMIDNDLRLRRLREEAADASTGLILLDVVLGEGAHPDPASELAPAIQQIVAERELPIAVLVVGTDEDPQDKEAVIEQLESAGATVFSDSATCFAAVAVALSRQQAALPSAPRLNLPLAAINAGLESFYDSLIDQDVQAIHVDWRPPAGGDQKLMSILARLKQK